jgi:ABC-type transporter Mla subunit MlaD
MQRIWANLSPLTEFAIVLITLAGLGFHLRWSKRSAQLGPTLLTTLGIFFCFVGIAWGLLDFDTADVKASVPHLLQGIRTSFWASVAGIGFALTIKARQVLFGEPPAVRAAGATGTATQGATIDDLLAALRRSREDSNQRLEGLTAAFEAYAAKVADSNSKALIQALQAVMRDFNAKINEQFGDNFKQLNAAVSKLVAWQTGHEAQLRALIEQETATRKNMTDAARGFSELVNQAGAFVTTAESLQALLAGLEHQREQLDRSLGGYASLVDKAATGLPDIERRIVAMSEQIVAGTQKHVTMLDKALEEELRRAIESLGRQLTALSQKFVQDYTPLTAQLQRVLQSARVS